MSRDCFKKKRCCVIGATGMVGQRLLTLLDGHPYFEVTALAASSRSAGKKYGELMEGRWKLAVPMPEYVRGITVCDAAYPEKIAEAADFVFCAVNMGKEDILRMEEAFAKCELPVVSNNSANRWTPDVPMLIPEINPDHLSVIAHQRARLGTTRGFIAVKPNCSIQSYVPMLTPLLDLGVTEVVATTYQAISGAGKTFRDWPEMEDNIIPYIGGEEEKSEQEPLRVWGHVENGVIVKADSPLITTQCIRVPVTDGHTAAVFIRLRDKVPAEEIIRRWRAYRGLPQELGLPHAPEHFITYFEENDRPSCHTDRELYGGMGVSAGRLRPDTLFDYKFVGLSHNTLRGAAGGSLLTAELLYRLGYLD